MSAGFAVQCAESQQSSVGATSQLPLTTCLLLWSVQLRYPLRKIQDLQAKFQ